MKILKTIQYQSGKVFVNGDDFHCKNLIDGDLAYHWKTKKIGIVSNFSNEPGDWDFNCNGVTTRRDSYKLQKIIAQHNLNLEGIPYMELEEDVKQLSYEATKNQLIRLFGGESKEEIEDDIQKRRYYFELEYKTAQPKKYTEEDLRKVIEMAREYTHDGAHGDYFHHTEEQIIQSLQPKIESIEVETKTTCDVKRGECECSERNIDCQVHSEKVVTYQKDGKTFIKITKINYL